MQIKKTPVKALCLLRERLSLDFHFFSPHQLPLSIRPSPIAEEVL